MIYTLTLNPAIDRVLFLDELKKDRTNRVKRVLDTIGGKGTHVSINLKLLGVQSTALGVTFGENGMKINEMMRAWGVDTSFIHFEKPGVQSRTNTVLIEETYHHCTMITEPGPQLSMEITEQLSRQINGLLQPGDILILTGDAGNVEDTAVYTKLAVLACEKGARVALDASGPYLKQALGASPFMIKPNHEELCYLVGKELITEEDIVSAIQSLEPYGIDFIVMTWGGKGAIVKAGAEIYRVHPVSSTVINEAGCGDAFLSAFIGGLIKDFPVERTLKMAASVAGAAAELDETTGFDPARAKELESQTSIERIA